MTAADKTPAKATAAKAAPAPNTTPESEVNPRAANGAAPGGVGKDAKDDKAAKTPAYVAVRRIRHGTKDAEGQRTSRTYAPGEPLDLDDDTAAVLLQRGDVKHA